MVFESLETGYKNGNDIKVIKARGAMHNVSSLSGMAFTNAFNDPCTLTNPRNISPEDIKEIYLSAYYGRTAKKNNLIIRACFTGSYFNQKKGKDEYKG
ncbi:hypothetical protein [Psychrilyobacter atlanticus]|uniref:hypothetical protein n=1 Tax=Psychrilyobacter atlanticus TaxID=271091 RepID=UPI0004109032|nr:hypothetical protein [Psychrilyobacter atlanticus]